MYSEYSKDSWASGIQYTMPEISISIVGKLNIKERERLTAFDLRHQFYFMIEIHGY